LPEAADRLRRRRVQLIALAQQHCSGQVVGKPDRLEVGRKEQATRTEHVVPIGVLEIMLAVVSENSARAGYGPALAAQSGNRSELSRAFAEPEMLEAGPPPIVPITALDPSTTGTGMGIGAPWIEAKRAAVVRAHSAIHRKQSFDRWNHR